MPTITPSGSREPVGSGKLFIGPSSGSGCRDGTGLATEETRPYGARCLVLVADFPFDPDRDGDHDAPNDERADDDDRRDPLRISDDHGDEPGLTDVRVDADERRVEGLLRVEREKRRHDPASVLV